MPVIIILVTNRTLVLIFEWLNELEMSDYGLLWNEMSKIMFIFFLSVERTVLVPANEIRITGSLRWLRELQ